MTEPQYDGSLSPDIDINWNDMPPIPRIQKASREHDSGNTVGFKADAMKPRLDLVDPEFLMELGEVLLIGSQKYDPDDRMFTNNWRQGFRWGRSFAAALRHMFQFWSGETRDKESGLTHLAHAAANIMFLHYYSRRHKNLDDRDLHWRRHQKIALDIDGVISNWTDAMIRQFEKKGIHVHPKHESDVIWWEWFHREDWPFDSDEEYNDFLLNEVQPATDPSFLRFEPALYVTHRPLFAYDATKNWLKKHGFPMAKLVVVNKREDKLSYLKENKIDILVEDRYSTFVEANNAGILCYLLDRPHNERFEVGDYRIYSLSELSQWQD